MVAALLFLLRGHIADLFGAEGLTRDLVVLFCGPLALLFFFNGVLFIDHISRLKRERVIKKFTKQAKLA